MIKHYILLPGFLLLASTPLFSQRYTDKWYFGNNASLDFTGGTPVAMTGSAMAAGEGSASIADSTTGALLFYTDGGTVWNKNNIVMPNGTGLMGGFSSTQAALIVPNPGNSDRYYIFTTDQTGGSLGLRASIVDMTLDGGNGDVVVGSKNHLLKTPVTEKLTAVQSAGTTDYWVVAHGWGDDAFYAYKVTGLSVDSAVVSHVGIVHDNSVIQNSYGQMKFNPCGDKLALAAGYLDKVEIFDFNSTTGVVSNPRTISYSDHVYGIEFSENGDVLYVTSYDPSATLIQYDLSTPTISAITSSAKIISNTSSLYTLQRARDSKIYVCPSYNQYLSVINSPDNLGIVPCNYVDNAIDLDPSFNGYNSGIGLPNFVQSFMGGTQFCGHVTGIHQNNVDVVNNVFPNPSGTDFVFSARENNVLVTVTDLSGQILESWSNVTMGANFRFGQNYPTGVYLVRTVDKAGNSAVLKVLKTR